MTDTDLDSLLELSRMYRAVVARVAARQTYGETPVTASLLSFPVTASARLISTVRLLHLDGRPFTSGGFLPGGLESDVWSWISSVVSEELGCTVEQVEAAETEQGDVVSVEGLPVYLIETVRPRALSAN